MAALTTPLTFVANETAAAKQSRLAAADLTWKQQLPALQRLLPVAARHLVLSPEGPLARLPWNLLTTSEVTLAPSLSVLAELGQRPPSPFRSISVIAHPSLRFAVREADAIAALTPIQRPTDIDQALRSSRILHFATHTTVDDREPALSGITLSDRTLRLFELYGKSIQADLVVLSSCRSASGPEISGEGTIGLARGFLHAGARRVIASLWSVDDQATARLMEHFYTELLRSKRSPSAALHAAQVTLRAEPRWAHPAYWSGFVLQGLALTADHLASLLAALGPEAADRYEQLRWRLVRLFQWERCVDPETLADEALDRLARRLAESEPVERIESYLFGIARLLLREEETRNIRQRAKLAEFARTRVRFSLPASGELAERLSRCLATLEPAQRRLVLAYYQDKQRERLAAELNLHMNALRNRVLRLREKLEKCVMSGRNPSLGKDE